MVRKKRSRGRPFKKGDKKPENSGRKPGVQNHRTVFVQGMLEDAVVQLGGLEALVAWVKDDKANERDFWTILFPKLIPLQIHSIGKDSTMVIKIAHEELAQKLVERGLPPSVYGVELPQLEDMRVINGSTDSNGDNGNGE